MSQKLTRYIALCHNGRMWTDAIECMDEDHLKLVVMMQGSGWYGDVYCRNRSKWCLCKRWWSTKGGWAFNTYGGLKGTTMGHHLLALADELLGGTRED